MSEAQPRAVIYIRVSSEKQVDGFSLRAQEKILKKYAADMKMSVVKLFREEGKSAYYTDTRPEFQNMLDFVKAGNADVILTYKYDRLSRMDPADSFQLLKDLKEHNIRFIAVADQLDTAVSDAFTIANHVIQANNFIEDLSGNVRNGQLDAAACCMHMGGIPPFGYKVNQDTKQLELDETNATAVKKAFQYYAEGESANDICDWLTKNGYKTVNGNFFTPSTLNSMFRNEKYRGCYTWDKAMPKDSKGHRNGSAQKEEYLRIEEGCPAIVSEKVWQEVQNRLAENSSMAKRAKPNRYYPLNGMIYCSKCGERMTGNVSYSGKHIYYQYRCSKKCGNRSVRADQLEESILNVLRDSLFSRANQSAILEALNQLAGAQKDSTDRRYQQLKAKFTGLEKSEENLLAAIEKGNVRTVITNRLERVGKEKAQVQKEINGLSRTKHTFTESDLDELSKQFTAYMQSQGDINTKRLIKSLIGRVDVSDGNVKITLADGISVDKTVKNTMYKEKNTMMNQVPTVTMDAVLMNAEMKNRKLVKCLFALRKNGELGFTNTCELSLSEQAFGSFAKYNECEYFDLFGSKFTLKAQLNDQGQIAKVISIEKAA
jgi:site-specific DNA recombinase